MGTLLIRRRRPIGESPAAAGAPAHVGLPHGTVGAGRIALALSELGFALDDVTQAVLGPELDPSELDGIDVGARFDLVVLGSHLVNLPEEPVRHALLDLARRHLAPGGQLLVEHHPLDWAQTAADVRPTPGGRLGMADVRRDPPHVSAVSVYDVGGRVVRQPFRARVLSDAELSAELANAGLSVGRRLGPTWLLAAPMSPDS